MSSQKRELFQRWALRISLFTTIIVAVLSWVNGVGLLGLLVRTVTSFGVMYFLLEGSLMVFEKAAVAPPPEETADTAPERGGLVDFSVGDDDETVDSTAAVAADSASQTANPTDSAFPGQVDSKLSEHMTDSQRQAEIVRRMGWG